MSRPSLVAFLALSPEDGELLSKEAAAVAWAHDAFSHLKVIGSTPDAQRLLDMAGVIADDGVPLEASPQAYLEQTAKERIWEREPMIRTVY